MYYGYIRVSSDKQTVENQRFEIVEFCKREGIDVEGWIEETISGTKDYSARKLGRLLRRTAEGDVIICSELSRLGRNLLMIMEILSQCMNKGVSIWTIKDGYRLGDDIQSKVLAFAFGLSAEIERRLISERTKEALARRASEGMVLGRPKGSETAFERRKLYSRRQTIMRMLSSQCSISSIARKCRVDRRTLKNFIRDLEKEEMK